MTAEPPVHDRPEARAVGVTGEDVRGTLTEAVAAGPGWFPLLVVGLLGGAVLAEGSALLLAPDIARSLGRSTHGTGSLLGLWSIGVVLGLPFALRAALGGRRVRAAACGGGLVAWGMVVLAVADSGREVAVAAVVAGAGSALCGATHRDLLADLYPPLAHTHVLAAYRAVSLLGVGIGLTVTFPLATASALTWRASLLLLAVPVTVLSLLLLRVPEPGRGRHEAELVRRLVGSTSDEPEPQEKRGFAEAVRALQAVPTARPVLAATALVAALGYGLVVFGGYALVQEGGLAPSLAPLVVLVAAWCGAAAVAAVTARAAGTFRHSPRRLVRDAQLLLVVVAAALALTGLVPWWPVEAVAVAVGVSALAVVLVVLDRVATVAVPPALRGAWGALASAQVAVVGVLAGGGAVAALDAAFGLPVALTLLGVAALVGAVVLRSVDLTVERDAARSVGALVEAEEAAVRRAGGLRPPLLSCRGIDFSYGPLQILFGVDVAVEEGEMVALLGTNGAGKSTLLRVVSGLGLPSAGTVRLAGEDVTWTEPAERVRRGICQIPGGKAVFGPLSVVDNLRLYGYALGRDRKAVERGIEDSFAAFPRLAERRNAAASTMSGGEQQMLALSKALILQPRLLLIDELSLGLAPKVVGELLEMVRTINATGTAVVLVEQSVNVALSLADRAYFMEKGQVRFDGRTADLLERPDILRSVFLSGAAGGGSS